MNANLPENAIYPTGITTLAGLLVGALIGAALDGMPVGMAAGVALGVLIDSLLNNRLNPHPDRESGSPDEHGWSPDLPLMGTKPATRAMIEALRARAQRHMRKM